MSEATGQSSEAKWKQHEINWQRLMITGEINVTTAEMKVLVRKLDMEDYEFHRQQINEDCWTVQVH